MSSNSYLSNNDSLSLRKLKNIILTILLTGLFFVTQVFAAGVNNISGIKKDIRVISKVLESSTELKGTRSHLRVSGEYLAKQGIVLKIRFPGVNHFDFNFDHYRSFPSVPVIPEVFSPDVDVEAIVAESIAMAELSIVLPEPPEAPEAPGLFTNGLSKEKYQLREQQRELRTQQRELESKARELERSLRKSNKQKSKQQALKQKQEIKVLRDKMKQKSKQMKKQLLELKKQDREKHQKNMSAWTNELMDNFCSYAPFPRNLPSNEYLTLVISNAVYVENRQQDKVIVLNNSQLKSCRDGKINGKELMSKSLTYSF